MQDLAAFREESTNIGPGIHGAGEHVWVFVGRLGLPNQATKNTREGDGLLHGATGASGCQGLQVERQVMLNRSAGLNGLDLESSTDVAQHGWAEGQRLGVMLLPPLVLGTQVEGPGVLEVWRENHSLVSGLTGELDPKIPRVESDEDEFEVLRGQVLVGERIEPVNRVPKRSGISYVFPSESCEAR